MLHGSAEVEAPSKPMEVAAAPAEEEEAVQKTNLCDAGFFRKISFHVPSHKGNMCTNMLGA